MLNTWIRLSWKIIKDFQKYLPITYQYCLFLKFQKMLLKNIRFFQVLTNRELWKDRIRAKSARRFSAILTQTRNEEASYSSHGPLSISEHLLLIRVFLWHVVTGDRALFHMLSNYNRICHLSYRSFFPKEWRVSSYKFHRCRTI